jgi:hypothetical protein
MTGWQLAYSILAVAIQGTYWWRRTEQLRSEHDPKGANHA